MLVVEQTNQRWVCDKPDLKKLMSLAYALLVRGGHALRHIDGHSGHQGNEEADALCNELLDQWMNSPSSLTCGWLQELLVTRKDMTK